ncbi:UNVERIFIED_CONTAM: hypothetical protein PVV62_25075, partial [Salmonella enterica subsp. enterica serovar Rissen]
MLDAPYNPLASGCAGIVLAFCLFPLSARSPARLPASLNRMVFMHLVNRLRSRHTRAFASKMLHET